jgi:anaerobic selenocysteine-containing dehydrogenase
MKGNHKHHEFDLKNRLREKTRVVNTVCHRDCPDTCFVDVFVEDGRIVSTIGSNVNPVTQGFLCPRGTGDPERVYSKSRVLYPHVKHEDKFNRVSWSRALDLTCDNLLATLNKHGQASVLLYDYPGNQGFLSWQYSQRFWRSIGATVTDGALCSTSGHFGIGLHYGLTYGLEFEDVSKSGVILFWGNNSKVSSPHLWTLSLRARKEKGTIIITIDPRKSETAQASDLWFSIRPGSDVALCYGIANYLIEQNKVCSQFIEEWTVGFDKFREEAKKWTAERVEKLTTLPRKRIQKLCELIAEKTPAAFMIGLGLNKSHSGAESTRAVSLLPALLGQYRGFHYSNCNGRFVDWEYLNGEKLSARKSNIVHQVSVGSNLFSGDFKFVFIKGSNPALTLPDQNTLRAGLTREDVFLIVQDTHWTETAKLADVVLPAGTYLEKFDLNFCDHHVYTRLSAKAIEPLGESMDETWVMQQIARKVGSEELWLYEDPWKALEKATNGAFENGSFLDLQKGKVLRLRQQRANAYQTTSGKIELYSSKALEVGANPLPVQLPLEEDEDMLVLLNSALPNWTHSQFRDVYGEIPSIVWINPLDAESFAVKTGDDVLLYNELSEVAVEAVVTENVPKGCLWSPRPLTGKNRIPLNSLMSNVPQTLGAGPKFNSTRVRMKKA